MKINKVELKNYRIHKDYGQNFENGINLLLGNNGSGKSSVLEAIGFALFKSDVRSLNQGDIVSKGEKNGSVKVFFTGNDEKEYEIERKFGSSTSIRLTSLGSSQKWTGKDIYKQVAKILDLDNTDGIFFESVICARQNQFIDIFTKNDEPRAKHFNELFDTAIYNDLHKKLGEQNKKKYEDDEISKTSARNTLATGQQNIEELEGDLKKQNDNLKMEAEKLDIQKKDLENKNNELNIYKKQKEYVSNKESELKNLESIIKLLETTRNESKSSLDKSEAAQKFLEGNKAKFDEYVFAKEQSDNLGKELQQFGNTKNYEKLQNQQRDMETKQTRLQGDKEKAMYKIESIEKQISTKQEDYAEAQKKLEAAIAGKKLKENEFEKINEQINELSPVMEEYNKLAKSNDIKKNEILELEKQKKELSNGICPILKAKCLAGDGTNYFEERSRNLLEEQIEIEKKLEGKKQIPKQLEEKKALSVEQQTNIKNIESKIDECDKNLKKINCDIQTLMKEKQDCSSQLKEIEKTAKENNLKLQELKPEIEKAEKQKIQAEELRNKIDKIKCEKLDPLRNVHDKYLENKSTAAEYERLKKRLADTEEKIQKEMENKEKLNKELSELKSNFSEEELKLKENAVENLRKLKDESIEKVANLKSEISRKNEEIKKFKETEKRIADLDSEIAIIRRKLELTADFRANIKDLGKIVAEERVRRIAVVASDYFNKITNRPESIRWVCSDSEKYSLYLGNGEEWHKFIDLSGGEQISVAIAIRLALSQAFGNSGLIILDEPTNNLDKNKRQLLSENLPKMVENLTQLFVVTHDDTFRNSATKVIEFNEDK